MIKWIKQIAKETGVDPSGIILLTIVMIGSIIGILLFLYGIAVQYLGI